MRLDALRPKYATLPALVLGLAACGGNPDTPEGRMADQRHENFEQIGSAFKLIGDELKKPSPDIAVIRAGAEKIDGFAPKVGTWFPAGTGPQDGMKTDALPAIWSKPEQFQQAAARLVDASAQFNALAQAGDVGALGKGAQDLGAACKNCHDSFRADD